MRGDDLYGCINELLKEINAAVNAGKIEINTELQALINSVTGLKRKQDFVSLTAPEDGREPEAILEAGAGGDCVERSREIENKMEAYAPIFARAMRRPIEIQRKIVREAAKNERLGGARGANHHVSPRAAWGGKT